MVFYLKSDFSLSDKLSVIIGFPMLCFLFPVVISHVTKSISMKYLTIVNVQELIINEIFNNVRNVNPFKAQSSHIIEWINIVAIVQYKWLFNQVLHFIYYVDESERRSIPIDIENIPRIPISLVSIQNSDELANDIKSRAQNAVLLFDKVLPENFVKWGLTNEVCNKFHSLNASFFKERLMLFYITLFMVLIAFSIALFQILSQS
jgi:hypothetical protein